MLVQLAEVHFFAGDLQKRLEVLDDAMRAIERTRAAWLTAEAQRLRAEALLALGRSDEADEALRSALALARSQGAREWEHRVAASLAKLRSAHSDSGGPDSS